MRSGRLVVRRVALSGLELDERTALESQLAKTTGKKVQARYARNPSLLGGALVRIGSTIYDGSVRGQLQAIKEQIAGE